MGLGNALSKVGKETAKVAVDVAKETAKEEAKNYAREKVNSVGNDISRRMSSGNAGSQNIARSQERAAQFGERAAEQNFRAAQVASHPKAPEPDHNHPFTTDSGSHDSDPGFFSILIWTVVMIAYDWIDLAADGATGGIANLLEFFLNIGFNKILEKKLGVYYQGVGKLLGWGEMIPYVDLLPLYTIGAVAVWFKYIMHFVTGKNKSPNVEKHQKISIFLNGKHSKWIIILVFLFMVGLIGAILSPSVAESARDQFLGIQEFFTTEGRSEGFFNKMIGKVVSLKDSIMGKYNSQFAILSGQQTVFEGSVDSARNLGLTAAFVKSQNKEFYPGQGIYLVGTVTGADLDSSIAEGLGVPFVKDRNVKIWCADQQAAHVTINGQKEFVLPFSVVNDATLDVGCDFGEIKIEGDSPKKDVSVSLNAEFQFMSAGYYKVPFVTSSKRNELESQGFRFGNYEPKFTPGPVDIKFDQYSGPLQIYDSDNSDTSALNTRSLSFSLFNNGKGTIQGIDHLAIVFPEGITPLKCQGLPTCSGKTCLSSTNDDAFSLSNVVVPPKKSQDFSCLMELSHEVLDLNFDVTEESFQVIADYKYRARETVTLTLIKERFVTLECGKTCSSQDGCTCPKECGLGEDRILLQGQVCVNQQVASTDSTETAP